MVEEFFEIIEKEASEGVKQVKKSIMNLQRDIRNKNKQQQKEFDLLKDEIE